MQSKECTKCNVTKPLDLYGNCKTTKDGKQSWCKTCTKESTRLRNNTKEGMLKRIYRSQVSSSKKRGFPAPAYTQQELVSLFINSVEFNTQYVEWQISGHSTKQKPSIDRKDDNGYYTLDNIQLMSWENNHSKGTNDIVEGRNTKTSKAVLQYSKNGALLAEYHSCREAARVTGTNVTTISICALGKQKTAGGFKWKFKEQLKG